MANVWISRKRWNCKYCDVTINDDLPSRRHHETGVRHKQNVQKALQDLYRKGEQERKDAEQTRKEMERIEALAAESYAKDQAAGVSSSSAPAASSQANRVTAPSTATTSLPKPSKSASRRPPKPTDKSDPQAPQPVAQAGEWEQVEPDHSVIHAPPASSSSHVEASDRDKARLFRMKEKVTRLDDSDDDDVANSTIKIKKRSRPNDPGETEQKPGRSTSSVSIKSEEDPSITSAVKKEEQKIAEPGIAKEEPSSTDSGAGGLFKKRKTGAGAGAKRVRAII